MSRNAQWSMINERQHTIPVIYMDVVYAGFAWDKKNMSIFWLRLGHANHKT